jgi:hypothetical protein
LDKALIRPGRIDLISEFTKCNNTMISKFIENFYSVVLTDTQKNIIDCFPEEQISPCELTKILFENYEDCEKGLMDIQKYMDKFTDSLKELKDLKEKDISSFSSDDDFIPSNFVLD